MKRILLSITLFLCSAALISYLTWLYTSKQALVNQDRYLKTLLSSRNSTDIVSTVIVLKKIRKGDIDGAAELLEKYMDVNLQAQSYTIPERTSSNYDEFIDAIKTAKEYRNCYSGHIVSSNLVSSVNKTLEFVNVGRAHGCE